MDMTEQCILGAILIDNDKINNAMNVIQVEDFDHDIHGKLYSIMLENHYNNIPNDYMTIYEAIQKKQYDCDLDYLIELTNMLPTAENINGYLSTLREKSNVKQLRKTFEDIITNDKLTSPQIGEILSKTMDKMQYVDNTDISKIYEDIESYIDDIADGKRDEGIIKTLYSKLDNKLSIKDGSFIVIGARPGAGKSAFALNITKHFAEQNKKALFVSLEMTRQEIQNRLLSMVTGVEAKKIDRREGLTKEEILLLYRGAKEIKKLDINIFDKGSLKVEGLVNLCGKLKQKGKLDILIVDYIGLLGSNKYEGQRANQIGFISRKLKQIAMDLKIPVIALSQLNRNVVDPRTGESREPNLTDLRDSGSVEQDANAVIFLSAFDDTTEFENRYVKCIIAKNRNGELGNIFMNFKTRTLTFREAEKRDDRIVEIPITKLENIFEEE